MKTTKQQCATGCVLLIAMLAAASRATAAAEPVKLNPVFGDHMVLQRDVAVPVWGTAGAGERVTVEFAGQTKSAAADAGGKWRVSLDPLKASAEPRELRVGGSVVHDVLVGEVWLAGGQSNMGFSLSAAHNAAEVLPRAGDEQLRYFASTLRTAAEPLADASGQWRVVTPETARNFSAVAYFFASELRRDLGCPVAILQAPWGGTPIQTWISLEGLKADPPLTRALADWDKAAEQYHKVQANPQLEADYQAELKRWQHDVAPAFDAATKAYNEAKAEGKPVGEKPRPATPEPQNPDPMGKPSPSRRPQTPTVSFNGMIAPLAPYAIRGVIWYQGEANASAGIEYRALFPRLIRDWRKHWGEEFPFLFVQLPMNGADEAPVAKSGEPWLREAQWMALREPRTAMAVALDVGDPNNVHPGDKLDVGHRLALLARRDVYGEKIVASGPLYRDSAVEGGAVRVRFTDVGTGLTPGQAPWRANGVEPLPTDRLVGFYVAGDDRKWFPADAKIDGDSVLVSSPEVPKPAAVRYGWANSPRCNLYNHEGLPASPFRTDDWDPGK